MNAPLISPIVDNNRVPIRPFSDFLNYVQNYLLPKGSIILFYGNISSGFIECNGTLGTPNLTAPSGCKYGMKV